MNHLTSVINAAEKEIVQLKYERELLDKLIKHLEDFIANGKRITPDNDPDSTSSTLSPTETEYRTKGMIVPESLGDRVRQILTEAGTPLRIGEIIDRLGTLSKRTSVINAMNRHPKIFRRVSPGVYGLNK